jgi:hypothetical protein
VIGLAMASPGDDRQGREARRGRAASVGARAGQAGGRADRIVGKLNEKARDPLLQKLVEWATPIQQRHFEGALQGSLRLAAQEDPNAPES